VGGDGGFKKPYNFDPLGLAEKSPELVPWFREAEIKHGRVCMLASVGLVVSEFYKVPGINAEGLSPMDAHNTLIAGPMQQLLVWIGLTEAVCGIPACIALMNGEREPGDFQFGMIFAPEPGSDAFKRRQLSELKNGRLAMVGFSGMVTQAVLTGHGFPYLY